MEQPGKRLLYIIAKTTNWDGLDADIVFVTRNWKEALRRFKWLYEEWVSRDFTNDGGEQRGEHNINIADDPKTKPSSFYWYDDDGECSYVLKPLVTDAFHSWANINKPEEEQYKHYLEERGM